MLYKTLAILFIAMYPVSNLSAQESAIGDSKASQPNPVMGKTSQEKPQADIASVENLGLSQEIEKADQENENDVKNGSDEVAENSDDAEKETEAEFDSSVPVIVRVNENNELVGKTTVVVNGEVEPVEAKVTFVRDGVVISSLYSGEDGSFAFPNVGPGEYNMYGSASSYVAQQPVRVLQGTACCDCVNLRLGQYNTLQYPTLSAAPASFSGPVVSGGFAPSGFAPSGFASGGFASGGGGVGSGGGLFGGGSVLTNRSGLRLLGIGGIATAIAVSVSDNDASPSE